MIAAARRGWLLGLVFLLAGCAVVPASRFVARHSDPAPDPQRLRLCQGYACHYVRKVSLTPAEWEDVRAILATPAADAAGERDQVARAVAKIDLLAAQHAGTAVIQRRDWINHGDPSQLDCVDKTVNTTTYLRLFERAGLLRWHHIGPAAHRGTVIGWDVANTAVLIENDRGRAYSIDTALGDPGLLPYVVPIETWIAGPLPAFRHNPTLKSTHS